MAANSLQIQLDVIGVGQAVGALNQLANASASIRHISGALENFQVAQGIGNAAHASRALGAALVAGSAGLAALTAGVVGLTAAVTTAVREIEDFARTTNALGGNGPVANVGREFGAAFGFNPVSVANKILGASMAGGIGTAAALRLGTGPTPPELALSGNPIDKAAVLDRALSAISNMPKQLALATLQMAGLDQELGFFIELSKKDQEAFRQYSLERAKEFTPERIQAIAHFNMELQKLKDSFSDLGINIGMKLVPAAQTAVDTMGAVAKHPVPGFFGLPGMIAAALMELLEQSKKAQQDNTEALNRNSDQLAQIMFGSFGGGPRARAALPAAFGPYNGQYLDGYISRHLMPRWGAYSVSL
jgi:hypothetical protein